MGREMWTYEEKGSLGHFLLLRRVHEGTHYGVFDGNY